MRMQTPTRSPLSFALQARHLQHQLRSAGVPLADMRRAAALELQYAGASAPPAAAPGRVGFEPLEGPIQQRPVARIRADDSRIGFFLDGAQRTLSHSRVGIAPISVVVAAVGIVQRDPGDECRPAPGSLRLRHVWLIPSGLGDPHLDRFRAAVIEAGMEVRDPLAQDRRGDEAAIDADYGMLQQRAYDAAGAVRKEMEATTLAWFRADRRYADDARWLVVDGRLEQAQPRTIGVVKQSLETYLAGPDAETMLSLPPGFRTTAIVPRNRDVALWYLRLWPADGLDARHALVRVEVDSSVTTTAEIDEISAWLLAERTPRATGDERWATLLYPIHHLERMLKRAIDAQTRGW